jgi:hypothetical protein
MNAISTLLRRYLFDNEKNIRVNPCKSVEKEAS